MKGLPIIIITSILFFTASCNTNKSGDGLEIDDSVKQIIFFSDRSNYQLEAPYYNAIIELKKQYPDAVKKMMILSPSEANVYYDLFKVKKCPAILVIYHKEIIVKVDDANSEQQITKPLSIALTDK
jgi:hypothetical protein